MEKLKEVKNWSPSLQFANSITKKIIKPILENYPDLKLEISELTTNSITKQLRKDSLIWESLQRLYTNEIEEDIILFYETLMVWGY
jgi:hypothetical protein